MPRMLDVLDRIRDLETELEQEIAERQKQWHYRIDAGRVRFEDTVQRRHKAMKTSIRRYLQESYIPSILSAPIIYSLTLPFVVLDLWVTMYQWICFPIYGIPLVRRSDYIALDRGKLAYLNGIEKANCNYCGYANGLLAYIREVTARTEQYWCPIKHAHRVKGAHAHYRAFVDYGDAEGYKKELPVLRKTLSQHK
ncbi:MAG: hypothetical protein ND807_12745 [Vicinamibacterales bacterium]|nr:hypothetical protein [Vicinamibacterales bacterium]